MRYELRENTWFKEVEENEIRNFAIENFNFYAPTVSLVKTEKGIEYMHIDGLMFTESGAMKRGFLDLGYYGPVQIRADGFALVDFEKVSENLEACRRYIHFIDGKNIGRIVSNTTYKQNVKNLYDFINKSLSLQACEKE